MHSLKWSLTSQHPPRPKKYCTTCWHNTAFIWNLLIFEPQLQSISFLLLNFVSSPTVSAYNLIAISELPISKPNSKNVPVQTTLQVCHSTTNTNMVLTTDWQSSLSTLKCGGISLWFSDIGIQTVKFEYTEQGQFSTMQQTQILVSSYNCNWKKNILKETAVWNYSYWWLLVHRMSFFLKSLQSYTATVIYTEFRLNLMEVDR